jgi:alanine racemase
MHYPQNITVAEIDLTNLRYNYHNIKKKVAPAEVMAVVKANAYGHGAVPIAHALQQEGVKYFAVARLCEAMELVQAGITGKILIFGTLYNEEISCAIAQNIRVTVTREEDFATIDRLATYLQKTASVHVKVDTGMGRVGLPCERAFELIKAALKLKNIHIEGICTHFATADSRDKTYTHEQLGRFKIVIEQLRKAGITEPLIHAANSGAVLDLPETYFDLVRPGITLYGNYPSTDTSESIALRQVMSLKTKVAQIREVPAGASISYGRYYITKKATRIAVLNIGYADGLPRAFTNKGQVMIKGQLYPMVGAVTMDQLMVEVGEADVKSGDDVLIWGNSPGGTIQATRIAAKAGVLIYELCCAVAPRIPRIYIDN